MEKHISVLKNEAIEALDIKSDGIYVDMTLGYAGHSKEILKKLNEKGFLFAFDKDIDAINSSNETLKQISNNYKIFNTSFTNMPNCLINENIKEVDGILYDLGVSSPELDEAHRGFSYMKDAKLDMRMDQQAEKSAYEVVNNYQEEELIKIFKYYGEEKHAVKIAKEICKERKIKPITTTYELVDIISRSYPYKDKRNGHPAKKVFQAIRIEVNNELEEFKHSLIDSLKMLKINGKIAVITFHSLEDRICKNIFKEYTEIDPIIKGMPNVDEKLLPNFRLITKKAILPSTEELKNNKRSSSAKLRVIEKIK